ncbi:hypothetical protein BESB_016140 [Besnoitia besnoiti]|uniref:Uncharacterized protein n=1 Tax=Besnoitia besnoiti TaxID=94643 RepID=A0A2A9M8R0_BESBE|nr:hypothetical protein BESB_016140 [Besnoitia besnoiti]PFH32296.1 hypothetical protein BESB_016140 [Besnoitia besnoiti]
MKNFPFAALLGTALLAVTIPGFQAVPIDKLVSNSKHKAPVFQIAAGHSTDPETELAAPEDTEHSSALSHEEDVEALKREAELEAEDEELQRIEEEREMKAGMFGGGKLPDIESSKELNTECDKAARSTSKCEGVDEKLEKLQADEEALEKEEKNAEKEMAGEGAEEPEESDQSGSEEVDKERATITTSNRQTASPRSRFCRHFGKKRADVNNNATSTETENRGF